MSEHVKILNRHSKSTGEASYRRTEVAIRGEFVNYNEKRELRGRSQVSEDIISDDPKLKLVRCENENVLETEKKKMEEQDSLRARKGALDLLKKEKERKFYNVKLYF